MRARRLPDCAALAAALLLSVLSQPAGAIDRIRARVDSITVAGVTVHEVSAQLDILSSRRSVLTAEARELELPPGVRTQVGRTTQLRLRCENPTFREPQFACPALRLDARAERLPPLHVEATVRANTHTTRVEIEGHGPTLAGQELLFRFDGTPREWTAAATLPTVDLHDLQQLIAPWYVLPAEYMPTGRATLNVAAQGRDGQPVAELDAELIDLGYSNADGTLVAEKLRANLQVDLLSLEARALAVKLEGHSGQLLAGPVYVDLTTHPLQLSTRVMFSPDRLRLAEIDLRQRGLAQATGELELTTQPFALDAAQLDFARIEFPGAYHTLLQIALTTTPFASLQSAGLASGSVRIANGQPVAVDMRVTGLTFVDPAQQLDVRDVNGELHWSQGVTGPPRPSWLGWSSARGWGVEGGRSRVDFSTQDRDVRLLRPARLPLWDGALVINQLEALNVGGDQLAGSFDAHIEPISLEHVTRALGWPEFGGRISGRIPGLTYRDGLLSLKGDLEAEVFDGTVVARNLSVRDPLGAWPRIHADITARNLDLALLTNTFEFGSITGRLDGDLLGLETFGWTPLAFDLRLATPDRDRSRRRISQRAVQNLSSIGGSGSGVAAALQSGVLRFFDEFRYQRLGLSCRLRDDVCEMGGVEPARDGGYYIVRGSGLPRIDIIGNQTRVDWPLLVAQVKAAVATDEIVIQGSRAD